VGNAEVLLKEHCTPGFQALAIDQKCHELGNFKRSILCLSSFPYPFLNSQRKEKEKPTPKAITLLV